MLEHPALEPLGYEGTEVLRLRDWQAVASDRGISIPSGRWCAVRRRKIRSSDGRVGEPAQSRRPRRFSVTIRSVWGWERDLSMAVEPRIVAEARENSESVG